MKILVTGANGQLGWELQRTTPDGIELFTRQSAELDITNEKVVGGEVEIIKPDWIINAAAYTAVDLAEEEAARAFLVNEKGPACLAQVALESGSKIIHVSTDFVFNGTASSPYRPEDNTDPIGVYGKSKLAGEKQLVRLLPADRFAIVRTAWVYSSHGNNFVKTMLRLMSEKDSLGVVSDQIGTPTWARGLAEVIWQMVEKDISGIYHWTDAGVASWYDFAVAIQEEALGLGLLQKQIPIKPLRTDQYPTPAARPAYSVLDKSFIVDKLHLDPAHWRVSLIKMLKELIHE